MNRYILRANEQEIFESFRRPIISALLGPRQVGKTTLIQYYMQLDPQKKWVRLNMDVLSQRNRVASEELEIMIEQEALQNIGGPKKIWVFIDEAQKCPELFDQVKLIYDAHKDQDHVKFILTGSAHLNLHQLTAESLAGRVELLKLREFNLKELTLLQNSKLVLPSDNALNILFNSLELSKLNQILTHLRPFQHLLQRSLDNHLIWGGLPELFKQETEKYRLKYLGDYLQTYLEKDIRAIDSISDLNLFQNLMRITAEHTGSLRDDTKIVAALNCSRNTLIKYRSYLQATLQYIELHPYMSSSIKRLIKSPKGYLINNGLVSYLSGLRDLAILKTTGLIGHRFENWFLNEIQTWLDVQLEWHQIAFWRTGADNEVDFVVTYGKKVIPFEVTYSTQKEIKKVRTLRNFMQSTPAVSFGVYCYMGPLSYDEDSKILFLPAWII